MKISFYIPAYNAEKTLRYAIESVNSQRVEVDEFFVVDDASTDHSREIAAGSFGVTPVFLKANKGLANVRNVALSHCSGELVASIDSDVVLEPDWLENLLPEFDDPRVAGVGGMLLETGTDLVYRWRNVHMSQHWGTKRIENPRFLYGADTVFRKSVLEEVGGYDLRFRNNNEDVDISTRILERGYKLIYNPDAKGDHLKQPSLVGAVDNLWNWYLSKYENERHFDSLEQLKHRIDKVDFGIFAHRFGLDLEKGNTTNLAVDALLGFRFVVNDLKKIYSRFDSLHTHCDPASPEGVGLARARQMVFATLRQCLAVLLDYLCGNDLLPQDQVYWLVYKLQDHAGVGAGIDINDLKDGVYEKDSDGAYVGEFARAMKMRMNFSPAVWQTLQEAIGQFRGLGY